MHIRQITSTDGVQFDGIHNKQKAKKWTKKNLQIAGRFASFVGV
jgi:hypothetical protein